MVSSGKADTHCFTHLEGLGVFSKQAVFSLWTLAPCICCLAPVSCSGQLHWLAIPEISSVPHTHSFYYVIHVIWTAPSFHPSLPFSMPTIPLFTCLHTSLHSLSLSITLSLPFLCVPTAVCQLLVCASEVRGPTGTPGHPSTPPPLPVVSPSLPPWPPIIKHPPVKLLDKPFCVS